MVRCFSVPFLILGLSILSVCNCGYFIPADENFSFPRTPYTRNDIQIDGYYIQTDSAITGDSKSSILFFYRNGVVLNCGGIYQSELIAKEERFKNGQYYAAVKDNKNAWGVFKIDSLALNMTFEWWRNINGSFRVIRYSGEILNDTTIHFTSSERIGGAAYTPEDLIYHFKQFGPKPDSVVSFIP